MNHRREFDNQLEIAASAVGGAILVVICAAIGVAVAIIPWSIFVTVRWLLS